MEKPVKTKDFQLKDDLKSIVIKWLKDYGVSENTLDSIEEFLEKSCSIIIPLFIFIFGFSLGFWFDNNVYQVFINRNTVEDKIVEQIIQNKTQQYIDRKNDNRIDREIKEIKSELENIKILLNKNAKAKNKLK